MSEYKEILLSERLSAIADAVPRSKRVFDVGSDHGYISATLLERGTADFVIATDIRKRPAERTRTLLHERGLSSRSCTVCTDGIDGMALEPGDTVIISGMGGYMIMDILRDILAYQEKETISEVFFLLQPQKSLAKFRRFLLECGFEIVDEDLCKDRDKWYVILHVGYKGKRAEKIPELTDLYLGNILRHKKPALWKEYLLHQQAVLEKIILGQPEYKPVLDHVRSILQEDKGEL